MSVTTGYDPDTLYATTKDAYGGWYEPFCYECNLSLGKATYWDDASAISRAHNVQIHLSTNPFDRIRPR